VLPQQISNGSPLAELLRLLIDQQTLLTIARFLTVFALDVISLVMRVFSAKLSFFLFD